MILEDEEYKNMWEWAREYINNYCIWRADEKTPKITGKEEGTWLTWEFHLKNGLLNADFCFVVSQMILHDMEKEYGSFDFQLAGMQSGSLPLLTSIPLIAEKVYGKKINAFSIKKQRNNYGLYNQLEGMINNKPVLLIDDICNTTQTLRNCVNTLIGSGCTRILDRPFVLINNTKIDKEDYETSPENYLPSQMSVVGLYGINDFTLPPIIEN